MGLTRAIAGGAITLVVGGTAYTVNKTDIASNFASDTGVSQQEANEYVNNIKDEDLQSWDKIGTDDVKYGQDTLASTAKIDCVNYTYEWVSPTLSCETGRTQLTTLGNDIVALGNSYIKLSEKNASESDMQSTIGLIDVVNNDFNMEIVVKLLDPATIADSKKANSYNKATLKAALDSN